MIKNTDKTNENVLFIFTDDYVMLLVKKGPGYHVPEAHGREKAEAAGSGWAGKGGGI